MIIERAELKELLKQGLVEVVFTKKDGSERQMICTLHPKYLPPVDDTPSDPNKPVRKNPEDGSDTYTTVYDTDADGWRSLHTDKIVSTPILIEEGY